ncbi:MAG: HAD-IIIA family hydrolase [Microbacterium sp.]|uniref:D-glycero-alpha-D-manno-heptose-1,7-bisphosphate 7-phosphatase n=1 Tax=Microbacterium sp. TaxID=51671 RepID=UPI001AC84267|nr:HAD-IIIA family hydrolase [Microbacterium sp.]MBN9015233.1 HAD-IIIA family hydrolase [Hyphomicrobiales bacterium]MBN9177777.1 HAD-IIIA family hydrolase [Microbacterium sp.]
MTCSEGPQVPWCLFLDRDGVINRRIVGDYVRSWEDFEFVEGAVEAIAKLSVIAPKIVVITNQQGVGKELMTAEDLDIIHGLMTSAIAEAGGRVDAILSCTHLAASKCDCRKPSPGLAIQWLSQNLEVDPSMSVMAGDSDSDIVMARNLASAVGGCEAVAIGKDIGVDADFSYDSLEMMASDLAWASGRV